MESYRIENLSFTYPERSKPALENISFTVNKGEFILICGKSGCGKTTLLRLLKPALAPHGKTCGNITCNEKTISDLGTKEQASDIGFVMQNPDNQIVTDKVWHELAFGLESLGCKQSEIRTRVAEMASFFGIQTWFYKQVSELSGGQKQLLNLASVMVMQPSVLILDEPASQLDPIAAGEFLNTLKKINRELGTTIIIAEHRLEEVFCMADRVIVMDSGKIIADRVPSEIGKSLKDNSHDMYSSLPTPVRVHCETESTLPCPINVREGRAWLEEFAKKNVLNTEAIPKDNTINIKDVIVEIKDAFFRYEKKLPDVVKGLDLSLGKGELFCLMGGNGTGKTTALSLISGLNTPYRGYVKIKGQNISEIKNLYNGLLGVLPQNPQSMFVKKTVYLDLMEMLSDKKLTKEEKEQKLRDISALCRIENLLESHPYDLSGGEQQRAALAKILLTEPEILLLDEATKGMDTQFKEEFADILTKLKENGTSIIMVSHDIEFCAQYADRCALMFDGAIVSDGMPREFFKGNNFYTTSANRMARTILPDAVLTSDIILACKGRYEKPHKKFPATEKLVTETEAKINNNKSEPDTNINTHKKVSKKLIVTNLIILLLIPLTIYASVFLWNDRKYYFTSLLIIAEATIPFIISFESRIPKARELVIISVLCAIAVAGRMAFFMLPQFKPVVAIIIITGVCFSGETGFLTGALTGFISNFFFGQGPWTPWQMFSLGIIGFAAGLLFKKRILKKTRASLCIFGFLSTLIIYGGIMNPASVIMWQGKITREMIVSSYITGLPFDLIHALSSAFFLWFISMPMTDKLERIKIKYGLIE